jgi:hypothetical protein
MAGVLAQLVERLVRKEIWIFSPVFPHLDTLGLANDFNKKHGANEGRSWTQMAQKTALWGDIKGWQRIHSRRIDSRLSPCCYIKLGGDNP